LADSDREALLRASAKIRCHDDRGSGLWSVLDLPPVCETIVSIAKTSTDMRRTVELFRDKYKLPGKAAEALLDLELLRFDRVESEHRVADAEKRASAALADMAAAAPHHPATLIAMLAFHSVRDIAAAESVAAFLTEFPDADLDPETASGNST
jgi:hypothetical protein